MEKVEEILPSGIPTQIQIECVENTMGKCQIVCLLELSNYNSEHWLEAFKSVTVHKL